MLASSLSLLRLRVAPVPALAALDALPPAFATWQGCKWDLQPAFY